MLAVLLSAALLSAAYGGSICNVGYTYVEAPNGMENPSCIRLVTVSPLVVFLGVCLSTVFGVCDPLSAASSVFRCCRHYGCRCRCGRGSGCLLWSGVVVATTNAVGRVLACIQWM
jgi:hypothetical protein